MKYGGDFGEQRENDSQLMSKIFFFNVYNFRELILLKRFTILLLSLLFLLYIANKIPLMSATCFNPFKNAEELWAWTVYCWWDGLLLILVGSRFFQHSNKINLILFNSPSLSNKCVVLIILRKAEKIDWFCTSFVRLYTSL